MGIVSSNGLVRCMPTPNVGVSGITARIGAKEISGRTEVLSLVTYGVVINGVGSIITRALQLRDPCGVLISKAVLGS